MSFPWENDDPYDIWFIEYHKKKQEYRLRELHQESNDKCKYRKLWKSRNKEKCDVKFLLKGGGNEFVHSCVLTEQSNLMHGAMMSEHQKKHVVIDCTRFSSSAVVSVLKWAYHGQLTFLRGQTVDVFGIVAFLGFEIVYAKLIKAVFEERVSARALFPGPDIEVVHPNSKKLVGQLLSIMKDTTYTVVPNEFYEDCVSEK